MSTIGHTTPNNGHTNNTQERTNNGTELTRTSQTTRVMCGSSSPSSVEVVGNTTRGLGDSQHTNCANRIAAFGAIRRAAEHARYWDGQNTGAVIYEDGPGWWDMRSPGDVIRAAIRAAIGSEER